MKIAREGGLVRVTLDRPEQRNVLSSEDCAALVGCLRARDAGAVLIESSGPVFCGGLEPGCDPGALFDPETWNGPPVVVAVQGPAVDEGVALIAMAHVVVAAQGVSFALTSMRHGEFPSRSYAALARAIGERRALELALTGRVFTTGDALAWGLVHQSAPAFEFDDRAEAVAIALGAQKICLQDVLC